MADYIQRKFKSDNDGRRTGTDRRLFSYTSYIPERRNGFDRRSGEDRRSLPRTQ